MKGNHTKKLFILGCERSGSTWLTNIFDANNKAICYMEPFADYANLFRSFPPRYIHMDKADDTTILRVSKEIKSLYDIKYPYFYKPGKNRHLIKLDHYLIYPQSSLRSKQSFRLLNLNHDQVVPKARYEEIEVEIIKELRLNFKVGFLKQMFPESKVLVSIRHPILQVNSILSWFEKGNLSELRRNLEYFFSSINTQNRFKQFEDLLAKADMKNMRTALYLYWIINYEVLIEDLVGNKIDYEIIKNEDLISNGLDVLENGFSSYLDEASYEYYRTSSTHSIKESSPTNTNRDSKNYLIEKMSSLTKIDSSLEWLKEQYESKAMAFYI